MRRVREPRDPADSIYNEYSGRIGELLSATVKKTVRGDVILDLGHEVEAVLPLPLQIRPERYAQGERVRAVITNVYQRRFLQVEVSRIASELLLRLFESEVPEIHAGKVVIKSVARVPGQRSKIAVISTERDLDPVDACLGLKGKRLQAILRELRGEKIDVIEWSNEPAVFAARALTPAKVIEVRVVYTGSEVAFMEAIVSEDQLDLASGKKGENLRVASELVGGRIDLKTEDKT